MSKTAKFIKKYSNNAVTYSLLAMEEEKWNSNMI
jgi:hypothetical protein